VRWRLVDVSHVLRNGAPVPPIGSLIGPGEILPDVRDLCLRLHRNVLAIALANKLARIAWSVLAHGRNFEARKIEDAAAQPA
jgi:hypothetical protein